MAEDKAGIELDTKVHGYVIVIHVDLFLVLLFSERSFDINEVINSSAFSKHHP